MKSKFSTQVAAVLCAVVMLATVAITTHGQQPRRRPVADTGVITVAPNQLTRLTVHGSNTFTGDYIFLFRRLAYTQAACNGGVCKHTIASQTTSTPTTLTEGEAASFDTGVENLPAQASGVRVLVLSNRTDVRVVAQIINRMTGEVVAITDFPLILPN